MPHDPRHKLTETEKHVFGADAQRHPITGEPLEMGSGALPPDVQAAVVHIALIEVRDGKAAADIVRQKLDMALRAKK
jgi:hypothetical protein